MNILELFARIGLKADQGPADTFLKTVNSIKKDILGSVANNRLFADSIKDTGIAMGNASGKIKVGASAAVKDARSVADEMGKIRPSMTDAEKGTRALGDQVDKIKPRAKDAEKSTRDFGNEAKRIDKGPAESFNKTLINIRKEVIGAVVGMISLSGAVKAVTAAMGDALELKKFSDATGASTDKMQQWRAVADQVSGSGVAVGESIKAIVSNQDKIKLGQGNISGYQLLGIDPRNDPYEVLKQIRDKTAKLEPGMRRNIIGMFGVSTDLISTLNLTNAQFDKMAARAYVISPAMIDGMNRARASMETVKNAVLYFTADLATKLGPAIEKVSTWLIRFVQFVERGVLMIDKLVRSTIGWKTAITAIIAVLAVMNAGFLLSPIGLFTMAIILLMAVMEDLYVYSKGGKSLFGVLLQKFPVIPNVFGDIVKDLKTIFDLIFGGKNGGLDGFFKTLANFAGAAITEALKAIKDILDTIVAIVDFARGDKAKLDAYFKAHPSPYTEAGSGSMVPIVKGMLQLGDSKPVLTQEQNFRLATPGKSSSVTNQNFNFTITGISDPKEAAKEAKNMFQREMQKAQNQSVSGKKEK